MLIWTLSLSGNQATKEQVIALAKEIGLLAASQADVKIVSFFPMPKKEVGGSNVIVTWPRILSPEELKNIRCENDLRLTGPWPDYVVGCRPEVAALVQSVMKASDGKSKGVQIQDPKGTTGKYDLDLNAFDLIVVQPHEKLTGPNVIQSRLAIHGLSPDALAGFREAGKEAFHSFQRPLLAVLVGGSDEHLKITDDMFHEFGRDLRALAEKFPGTLAIVTGRRTEKGKEILKSYVSGMPNVCFDDGRFPYKQIVANADAFLITAETSSQISEGIAMDKPVWFYDFDRKLSWHPLNGVVQRWVLDFRIRRYSPDFSPETLLAQPRKAYYEMRDLGARVRRFLAP